MIDQPTVAAADPATAGPVGGVSVVERLAGWIDELAGLPASTDSAEQVDRIAVLERLAGAVAAARAEAMTQFGALQVAEQAAAGVPRSRLGRGVAEQIGYARRISPATAARELNFAATLQAELPAVFQALRAGQTSEWVARLVVDETREIPRDTRRRIAEELAPDLPNYSPKQAATAARRMAYEADPQAVLARSRTARSDRYVNLRPAPDTMAILTAFLPVEQGVAAYANLDKHAKAQRAAGDPRTLGQLRADTLVERLTGQAQAAAVPVEINLTMTADTLLNPLEQLGAASDTGADQPSTSSATSSPGLSAGSSAGSSADKTPAQLNGYGPIPADLALDLAANAYSTRPALQATPDSQRPPPPNPADGSAGDLPSAASSATPEAATGGVPGVASNLGRMDDATAVWVRRLVIDPVDDSVTQADSRRRRFDVGLARLIRYRDQTCRETYCDAQIRHFDHVEAHRDGGPTTAPNGAGLCERGNYVKEMPGWIHTVLPDNEGTEGGGGQRIEIRTPTGHRYISAPPPALGPGSNYQERARRTAQRRPEPPQVQLHVPSDDTAPTQPRGRPTIPSTLLPNRPLPTHPGSSQSNGPVAAAKPAKARRSRAKVRQYKSPQRRRTNKPLSPPRRN